MLLLQRQVKWRVGTGTAVYTILAHANLTVLMTLFQSSFQLLNLKVLLFILLLELRNSLH